MNIEDIKYCLSLTRYTKDSRKAAELFSEYLACTDDYAALEHLMIETAVKGGLKQSDINPYCGCSFVEENGMWQFSIDPKLNKPRNKEFGCSHHFLSLIGDAVLQGGDLNGIFNDVLFAQAARGVLGALDCTALMIAPNRSLARTSTGVLVEHSKFGYWLKDRYLRRVLVMSAISVGDADGLGHLLGFEELKKEAKNIESTLKENKTSYNNPCWSLAYKNGQEFNMGRYVYLATSMSAHEYLSQNFDPEINKKCGHEIIYSMMSRNDNFSKIVEKVTQDGADWYMGYKMYQLSHACHLDLAGRHKNSVEELKEIVEGLFEKRSKINDGIIRGIINGVDIKLKVEVAKIGSKYADIIYDIAPHPDLTRFMSKKAKGRALSQDLEI